MPRILLVDDDDRVRAVMHRILASAGYEVKEASDGRMALRAYAEQRPDIVLTDILMPGCDGLELILDMRRQNPAAKIIAISAGGTADRALYLTTATEFGAVLVLQKPFSKESLLRAVAEAISAPEAAPRPGAPGT